MDINSNKEVGIYDLQQPDLRNHAEISINQKLKQSERSQLYSKRPNRQYPNDTSHNSQLGTCKMQKKRKTNKKQNKTKQMHTQSRAL